MFLIKSSPSVVSGAKATAAAQAAASAGSSQSRERNNCLIIGANYLPSAASCMPTSVTNGAGFQQSRRSICSVNSTSPGSRCSSRSSSSSDTSASAASGNLLSQLSSQPVLPASQLDRDSHFNHKKHDPLERLTQQLASRAASAQSFSRVNFSANLKQQQQQHSSIFELLDKYLTPTQSYASSLKQQPRTAANRSQSLSAPRFCSAANATRPQANNQPDSLTKSSRAPKRVSSCITPSSISSSLSAAARKQHSKGTPASRLVSYVSSVRGSSLSSIQTRFSSTSSSCGSPSAALTTDSLHHPKQEQQLQKQQQKKQQQKPRHHCSLLHNASGSTKRRQAHSTSASGASLFSSLFGAEPGAHARPASSSLVSCVRRELTKLLKSF